MILITGSAGFIGSNFTKYFLSKSKEAITSYDKLTYAGNLINFSSIKEKDLHSFIEGDISDEKKLNKILSELKPRAIINFAAETHVDKSIQAPEIFFKTNVMGTFSLLTSTVEYWRKLKKTEKENFRFLHVSTDEVYGSLDKHQDAFTEENPFKPNSPYSASKASSDHIVRSFNKTYGLPTLTSNCSNNYGPYQYPEKIIPLTIINLLNGKKIPIYGDGKQIRDWLYVKDHCRALLKILDQGKVGEIYNVGGRNQIKNIDLVKLICNLLENFGAGKSNNLKNLIDHVKDRPGHDTRYEINTSKISNDLGWQPKETFETGMTKTVSWYLDNYEWIEKILDSGYSKWIKKHYK